VRHGHLPEREVMTRIGGPVAVRQPRVRGREAAAGAPGRVRVTPAILEVNRGAPAILYLKRYVDISPPAAARGQRCSQQPPPLRLHFLLDHVDIEIAMPAHRK
jgi:hypothetical protein